MIRAGELRHQVSIQTLGGSPPQDAGGAPDTSWGTSFTAMASIEPLRGRELVAAQAVQSEVTGQIRIRYRAGVTTGMRVLFGTRIYDILSVVNPFERNEVLLLMVKEGTTDG